MSISMLNDTVEDSWTTGKPSLVLASRRSLRYSGIEHSVIDEFGDPLTKSHAYKSRRIKSCRILIEHEAIQSGISLSINGRQSRAP